MRKLILITAICLVSIFAIAQEPAKSEAAKQDTIIQINFNLDQYKAVMSAIDANIDSKKASKEIIEFIAKNAKMVQPADKPKTDKPK